MFGWRKKKLLSRMQELTQLAQLIFGSLLMERIDVDELEDVNAAVFEGMRTAAYANYLFGKPPLEEQKDLIDLDEIKKDSLEWLRKNTDSQELVVQSLRVLQTAIYAKGDVDDISIHPALAEFGKNYPDAPNPTSYEKLVNDSLSLLTPTNQRKIREFMKDKL